MSTSCLISPGRLEPLFPPRISPQSILSTQVFFECGNVQHDADDYLKSMYGENMTQDVFKPIITRYLLANQYMSDLESGYTLRMKSSMPITRRIPFLYG
jgi:hypothetical protein